MSGLPSGPFHALFRIYLLIEQCRQRSDCQDVGAAPPPHTAPGVSALKMPQFCIFTDRFLVLRKQDGYRSFVYFQVTSHYNFQQKHRNYRYALLEKRSQEH